MNRIVGIVLVLAVVLIVLVWGGMPVREAELGILRVLGGIVLFVIFMYGLGLTFFS